MCNPMQSYAVGSDLQHKNVSDLKDVSKKIPNQEKANQHLNQDNACYRGDDCQQAIEGQQIVGKDNERHPGSTTKALTLHPHYHQQEL